MKEIQIMTSSNSSTDAQPAKRYFLNGKEIDLQLNGSDDPSCPNCKRYNAMQYDGSRNDSDNDFALKCRDCGAEVVAVHTRFPTDDDRLPWVREGGGSLSILDNDGRHIAELAYNYYDDKSKQIRKWTDEEIDSHAETLTRALPVLDHHGLKALGYSKDEVAEMLAPNAYPELVKALREARRTLEALLTCDHCAACEYCNGHQIARNEVAAIDDALALAEAQQ
jgi:MoaA/NifB/PqqE/SkfB family radical SAM enzyme